MIFPDRNHVEVVRDALWRHQPLARAAVMIGSGFSRNAMANSPSARSMPTWHGFATALCEELYPRYDALSHEIAMRDHAGTSGFLRLAQEFEAGRGRTALNERIRGLVPDLDYAPGDLHKRLLSLRWADVFTTNWDTLLERACSDVFDRSYDIVRTASELAMADRPRITKLHGSLPAHEPFIVTEEDYRSYPTKFAPFVNLVQQSMLENVFVLIGFSGDDPNFLHWSGWVRDNLGAAARKIYLVGYLELSDSRRRMLEGRNVIPIDLAKLPQAAEWPDMQRHAYATEWFLRAIELDRPVTASHWPTPSKPVLPPPSVLGDILQPARREPKSELFYPDRSKGSDERLRELCDIVEIWRWNRNLYPGWIVAPAHIRSRLWSHTEPWITEIAAISGQLSPIQRLLTLGELFWRLDISLAPYFSELDGVVGPTLEQIDCKAKTVSIDSTVTRPTDVNWSGVEWAWMKIGCTVLRGRARKRG
jgi:hypothetical protein